jgi:hypothetical protein
MPTRTALLMNFVAPYRIRLLEELQRRVGELQIFVSTKMEPNRHWEPEAGQLKITEQKTKTFFVNRRHPMGFRQELFIHFPYDTISLLRDYAPKVIISGELGLRTLQAVIYRLLHPSDRLIVWATLSEETERHWGLTRRLLRKFLLSVADGVLCNGRSGARYIASFGFDRSRIFIVNQPVDTELFAAIPPVRTLERAYRLVYSGRLIRQKGVHQLQAAIAEWAQANPDRHVELLWIGDGEDQPELLAVRVPDNFSQTFVGNVAYDALPELYGQAGALILPTLLDEWGLVVNEAMVTGLVVLGSNLSQAVTEMVTEDETGWVIDPREPHTIKHALDLLFATPLERLAEMRVAARARALMISPAVAADQMSAAIAAVLDPGNSKPSKGSALRVTQPASNFRPIADQMTAAIAGVLDLGNSKPSKGSALRVTQPASNFRPI